MAKSKGMTERELIALLDRAITTSETSSEGETAQIRRKAIQFINGEVDIPAEPGKSSVVSHDVADTLHWIMPSLLRVFMASENIGVYEPRRQEIIESVEPGPDGQPMRVRKDVSAERATQATDYVNYALMYDCQGYSVIHSAMYDALAYGNGLIKHWWDGTPQYAFEDFSALSDDAFTALVAEDDVEEVVEHTEYDDPEWTPPPMPEPDEMLAMAGQAMEQGVPEEEIAQAAAQLQEAMTPPKLHDCKIKRKTANGRLMIRALPHEEFIIGPNDLTIDEDETFLVGHVYRETRSNLVKQGYDRKKIDNLPSAGERYTDETKYLRRGPIDEDETDRANQEVEISECYVLVDYDGDGIAERWKVVLGGGNGARAVLDMEEWGDDLPFTDLVPDPVPHRWRGRSLYEEVGDIQRIKTVLHRQTLDNLYQTNNPMNWVEENSVKNMDVLVNRELGGTLIGAAGKQAPQPLAVPFVAKESFAMMEYLDMVRETRTGVSRQTTGLDMEALQNQTATAFNAAQSAAYSKMETYARNIAENGMKRLFGCLLRLICKHHDRARTIRLRGDWVEMDPRAWNADMDVYINTGLGSGSRERDLAMLNAILNEQKQIIQQAGPFNPIVSIRQFRDTLARMVEVAGLKSPEQFFSEVSDEDMQAMQQQAQESGPDPKMAEAQAKMQLEQMKAQADMQMKQAQMQADLEADQAKMQMEFQMRQMEAEAKRQGEIDRITKELALKRDQMEIEAQLRREQMQAEMQLKRELAMMKIHAQADIDLSHRIQNVEMGGDVG